MPKINHMLWFDDQALDAATLYTDIFDGEINQIAKGPNDMVFTVEYTILGQTYIALNGGPLFTFNEAFSIFVSCDGQAEVDKYWDAFISSGGSEGRCGWLKDKYGVSWQIVPVQLGQALSDPKRAEGAMAAMMQMSKIIVADLG